MFNCILYITTWLCECRSYAQRYMQKAEQLEEIRGDATADSGKRYNTNI